MLFFSKFQISTFETDGIYSFILTDSMNEIQSSPSCEVERAVPARSRAFEDDLALADADEAVWKTLRR